MKNNKVVNLYGFPINKDRKKLAEALDEPKTTMAELQKLADLARVSMCMASL